MVIKRKIGIGRFGRDVFEFLIKCHTCDKEQWLSGKNCNFGARKYCSRSCINKGRKHTDKWKETISKRNTGHDNPFFGKKHSKKSKKIMSESHTCENSLKAVKTKELSEIDFKKYWASYVSKFTGENNHFFGKTHTKETREHLSKTRSKLISNGVLNLKPNHYGLKGYYTSKKSGETFRFDSFVEYLRMIIIDNDAGVLTWTKRHGIRIPYEMDGITKNYVPDLLITLIDGYITIEEVKGYENTQKKEAKFNALKSYCKDKEIGCSIVLYKDVKDICPHHFGKSIDTLRSMYKKGLFNG